MTDPLQIIPLAEARPPFFAGVDLGGTNTSVGVVDDRGRLVSRLALPTQPERGPEDATARIGAAVLRAIAEAGLRPDQVRGVGLGAPGTMDLGSGTLLNIAHFPGWEGFAIRDRLAAACGLPVTLANDADAAAAGEFWVGSGRKYKSLVLFTLGTGVGTGIVLGNRVLLDKCSQSSEGGHMIIDCTAAARPCNCGQRGHLDAYVGATAVVKRTREALDAGRSSSLAARLAAGDTLSPKLVAEEAEAGDELALEIVLETARYLAVGIVNELHTIDPDAVLLGGAMTFGGAASALGRRFLAAVKAEVSRRAFALLAARTAIEFAALGPAAGLLGAARLARSGTTDAHG